MKIQLRRSEDAKGLPYPAYATAGSSGLDLCACNRDPIRLEPGKISLIPTGISLALPAGYEAQVRARSGLALKHGLTLVNAPGTIDSDYRGEIGVIATILSSEPFIVERGMRIAQLVVAPVSHVELCETKSLDDTLRGAGGFGHTGLNEAEAQQSEAEAQHKAPG